MTTFATSIAPQKVCSVPDCGEKHCARGMCRLHYGRMRETEKRTGKQLSPEDTETIAMLYRRGLGMSLLGYVYKVDPAEILRILERFEIPTRRRGQRSRSIDGYTSLHLRLRRMRGPAAAHRCVDCGGPAAEWSYNRSGVAERKETTGRDRHTFSSDIDQYDPRCRPCHRAFDNKLSVKLAAEIRWLWSTGEWDSYRQLAVEFGVSVATIGNVLAGRSWKTAGGPLVIPRHSVSGRSESGL